MWTKIQFWSHTSIIMYHIGTFVDQKRLIRAVLSIPENFRSKGHRPSLPHDQIWAKIQFGGQKSTQMYQAATFIHGKDLLGQC